MKIICVIGILSGSIATLMPPLEWINFVALGCVILHSYWLGQERAEDRAWSRL